MRVAAVAAGLVLAACGGGDRLAPPELHLGEQACEACAMAVSDARVAASMIVETGGERRDLIFDDVGCLLAYEAAHGEVRSVARYVRDYDGSGWLPAESATYLLSDAIPTPMRYGIAAFASRTRAEDERRARGGEVLDLDGLRKGRAHS